LILENHIKGCIKTSLANNPEEEVIDELINTMVKFIK
jgi:DNA-binding FrmR family transcriptional regulator